MLIATGDQHPAILPWSLCFGWRPSFRVVMGIWPRPAAGLLLGVLCLSMIFPEDRYPLFRVMLLRVIVFRKFESPVFGRSRENARNKRA
jgi:hypothetical protein